MSRSAGPLETSLNISIEAMQSFRCPTHRAGIIIAVALLTLAAIPALGARTFDAKIDQRFFGGDRNSMTGDVAFHVEGPAYEIKPSIQLPYQCSVASDRFIPEMGVEELEWQGKKATVDYIKGDVRTIRFYAAPRFMVMPHFGVWIKEDDAEKKAAVKRAQISGPGFPRNMNLKVTGEDKEFNAACGHWTDSPTRDGWYEYTISGFDDNTSLRIFTRPKPDYISPKPSVRIDKVTLNIGNDVLVLGNNNDIETNPSIEVDREGGKILIDIESILRANGQLPE